MLNPLEVVKPLTCYGGRAKDEKLLLQSSSGGIFGTLARHVLKNGGCVFGCVLMQPDLKAAHIKVENLDALARMHKSKYVQSDLGDTFRDAKREVDSGRQVLFSGTPCQIAGLCRFLGKAYPNLLMVDLLCHGCPSSVLFDAYKQSIERHMGCAVRDIRFRDKTCAWEDLATTVRFDDSRKDYTEKAYDNSYIHAFTSNRVLRFSCYDCSAKGGRSGADLTIGDFWRYKGTELADHKGISVVIVKSNRGTDAIRAVKNELTLDEIADNPSAIGYMYRDSVKRPLSRSVYGLVLMFGGRWRSWLFFDLFPLLKYCKNKMRDVFR